LPMVSRRRKKKAIAWGGAHSGRVRKRMSSRFGKKETSSTGLSVRSSVSFREKWELTSIEEKKKDKRRGSGEQKRPSSAN